MVRAPKPTLPSGHLTTCYLKWPFIVSCPIKDGDVPFENGDFVDLPSKNGWIFHSKPLPEGNRLEISSRRFSESFSPCRMRRAVWAPAGLQNTPGTWRPIPDTVIFLNGLGR